MHKCAWGAFGGENLGNLGINEIIMLKWALKKWCENVVWIYITIDKVHWHALVNTLHGNEP